MVAFTAASVLTASALNSAFNAYTVNAQTGTTYTFVLTDQGGLVTASNASASTYTVPANATVAYATGTRIELLNIGAGTVTLSPAGGVTLTGTTTVPQNGRVALVKQATNTWYSSPLGGGGLTFITSSAFSAVASVSVNSCFTSAYDNYRVVVNVVSSANVDLQMRMRVAAADHSAAGYYYAHYGIRTDTAAAVNKNGNNANQWVLSTPWTGYYNHVAMDVLSPALTRATGFTLSSSGVSTADATWSGGGILNTSTAYDGFSLFPSSGTITGTVRVYGYQN